MEKFNVDSKNDIVEEPYKGPSVAVESAGRGFLEHLAFAITGLLTAGTLAFVFHKPAKSLVDGARELGATLKATPIHSDTWVAKLSGQIKRGAGGFLHGVFGDVEIAEILRNQSHSISPKHKEWFDAVAVDKERGFGNAFLSHTLGILPVIGKPVKGLLKELSERESNAITVGGIAGLAGYIGGWAKAAILGGAHGNQGKRQFKRAQAEIKELRERNDDLEKINDDLHEKYVEVSTRLDRMEAPPEAAPEAPKHTTNSTLDSALQAEHQHAKAEHALHAAASEHAPHEEKPKPHIHTDAGHAHHGKLQAHAAHEHAAPTPA